MPVQIEIPMCTRTKCIMWTGLLDKFEATFRENVSEFSTQVYRSMAMWCVFQNILPEITSTRNVLYFCFYIYFILILYIYIYIYIYIYVCVCVCVCDRVSCSGMLGELVGSHTKVAIYPSYTIHCKRLLSVPRLILGSRGTGSELPN